MARGAGSTATPTWVALALILTAILLVTLLPDPSRRPEIVGWCLLCGERGTADALLNVALFVPFGAALSQLTNRRFVVLAGAGLSLLIEGLQTQIPGRDPSLSDITMNTLGSLAGSYVLDPRLLDWVFDEGGARRLAGTTFITTIVFIATGLLLNPSYPDDVYYGQWTRRTASYEPYLGRVTKARIADVELPSEKLPDSDRVRQLLASGAAVEVSAVAGPAPTRLASLFSIADAHGREILFLGPEEDNLVFRYRTVSASARLDQPPLGWSGAMRGVVPGDSIRVSARSAPYGWCLRVNQKERCGIAFTIGSGWRLLFSGDRFPDWALTLTNAVWLSVLLVPLGYFWQRGWPAGLAAASMIAGMILVPWATTLGLTPPVEWMAAIAGALGGLLLKRLQPPAHGAAQAGRRVVRWSRRTRQ